MDFDKEIGDNFAGWTIGGRHFGGTYGNRRGNTTEHRVNKACHGTGMEEKRSEQWSDPEACKGTRAEQHKDSGRQEKGFDPDACKGTRTEQHKDSAHQQKYSDQRFEGGHEEKRSWQYSDASRQVNQTEQKKSSSEKSEIGHTEELVHRSKPPMWEKFPTPPGAFSYSYSYAPYQYPYAPPYGGYPSQMPGGDHGYYGGYHGHGQGYSGGSYAPSNQGGYGISHNYDGGHRDVGFPGGGAATRAPAYGYGQHETFNRPGAQMKMGSEAEGYGHAAAAAYYGHSSRAVYG